MATEIPMRVVEGSRGAKWRSSLKDTAPYGSPLNCLATEEHGSRRNKAVSVPNRSGSAPPSMEGSVAAFKNLSIEQKFSAKSSPNFIQNAQEDLEFGEHVQSDRAYMGSLSSHKEDYEGDSPPEVASQDIAEYSGASGLGKNKFSSASHHKSAVDLIQADFPRTPSPVYNQSRSSPVATTDELADHDSIQTSSTLPSGNKITEPNSHFVDSPKITSMDSQDNELKTSNPHLATSFSTQPLDLGESKRQMKDKSSYDTYADLHDTPQSQIPMIDSTTNLETRKNQEKQQAYVKNASKLRVSVQEDIPTMLQDFQGHTISRGVLQPPGIVPRLYAAEAAYANSGNHFFPNLQQPNVYAPQYSFPGYGSGSSIFPPAMAGYPSHNLIPFPSSPSYIGVNTGISTWERIPRVGDMQHQGRYHGSHGSIPQPSPANHIHMQYYPQPSQHIYGSFVQYGQVSPRGPIGSQFVQPESTFPAYMGDQKFGLESMDVSVRRNMEISGYGNSSFVNVMTQLPASPLPSPLMPSSPMSGSNYPGHRISQGLLKNPETCKQGKSSFNNSEDSNKFSFLEELKSGNAQMLKLSSINGRVAEFSVDQHGSRFIQQKLENCSEEEKMSVFKEVLPHASRLMVDVFGNYVIQKFLEYGSAEQKKELANKLCGQMLSLSVQMYGCRVIQKALEAIEIDQKTLLVKELDGHVMKCVHDQNGNHVIQKCIETLPTENVGFILSSFKGHVPALATHPYGCRVIQRVLEHCSNDAQCQCLVDEILESACFLAQDQYGNYVTQHVLQRGKPHERCQIISKVTERIVQMSQHKFASNVVEKCLEYANATEQEALIQEILQATEGNDNLLAMMKDQYANYVVQKIFETSNARQRELLLNRIRVHFQALRKYTYGKHIVARFEQLSCDESQTSEPEVA